MKIISFLQTHLSACAKEKHKGILFNELTRILMSNSYNLTESDRDKIVHFKSNQPSSIFKKTALNWANENEDRVLASELLKLEHEIHRTEVAGLKCLRDNLSNDALMAWIIEFYRELANDQSECKRQAVAFLFVFLVLGLLSYLPFSWDLYSDISADISYWRLANGLLCKQHWRSFECRTHPEGRVSRKLFYRVLHWARGGIPHVCYCILVDTRLYCYPPIFLLLLCFLGPQPFVSLQQHAGMAEMGLQLSVGSLQIVLASGPLCTAVALPGLRQAQRSQGMYVGMSIAK